MNEWRFQKYVDGFDSIDLTTIQRIGPVIVPKYGAYLGESLGTYFPTPWMTGGVFITPDKDRELHGVVYRLPRNAFEQLVSAPNVSPDADQDSSTTTPCLQTVDRR